MTTEEYRKLRADLTTRVPYGLRFEYDRMIWEMYGIQTHCVRLTRFSADKGNMFVSVPFEEALPYLRSLEDMTEAEKLKLKRQHEKDEKLFTDAIMRSRNGDDSLRGKVITHYASDWCDRRLFDHRGLIEMGLAVRAPQGFYDDLFGFEDISATAWLDKVMPSEEALKYLKAHHSPSEVSDFQAAMNIAVMKAYDAGRESVKNSSDVACACATSSPVVNERPKFEVGDVMRTLQEAADNITSGLPVVVHIGKKHYHCTNELIAIKNQDDYEYPPMNRRQKSDANPEPKFKAGVWVQIENGNTIKILEVNENTYKILNCYGSEDIRSISDIDCISHLWTIEDAKDGDVLVFDGIIMIFKSIKTASSANTYILYYNRILFDDWCDFGHNAHPATKEQRDFLFQKMHEVGYGWCAETKQLIKFV